MTEGVEDLLRALAPQVLGALLRRYGDFHDAEDAVQEALLAAAVQWPADGIPENPRGWLVTVAGRRLTDAVRSEVARRRRESEVDPTDAPEVPDADDTLRLLYLCCHPELTAPSQIALTLRAVGGLSTAEIAGAFLVPETTMGQRISRAKQRIAEAGARFAEPSSVDPAVDSASVLHVLYLIFNEGHTATAGPQLHRVELTTEAIRLTREVYRLLPGDGEVAGLLALMLLTDARRAARLDDAGRLVPLAEQDRDRWDAAKIAEGVALVTGALAHTAPGPYQLQAAIAALHAEAACAEDTDWPQILVFYELLASIAPSPVVTLNHAVALAMVRGPRAGLDLLAGLAEDRRLAAHHRLHAVRAHLLELAGDPDAARVEYAAAAKRAASEPERRYLLERHDRLD